MNRSKHPKTREGEQGFQSDLDRNPGIGQSKGTFSTGEDPESLAADNTYEGDVENDAGRPGGGVVDPNRLPRHNK